MKPEALTVVLLGLVFLGASPPAPEEVRPYFGKNFEEAQILTRHYEQAYHQGIRITGTAGYIARIREALDLLEEKDPRNWYYVRKHIRRITLSGHPGMDIGGGRLTTGSDEGAPVTFTAGSIVHEAWHRELFFAGRSWEGREAEVVCLQKQNESLARIGGVPLDLEETVGSEYWKVDYWRREW